MKEMKQVNKINDDISNVRTIEGVEYHVVQATSEALLPIFEAGEDLRAGGVYKNDVRIATTVPEQYQDTMALMQVALHNNTIKQGIDESLEALPVSAHRERLEGLQARIVYRLKQNSGVDNKQELIDTLQTGQFYLSTLLGETTNKNSGNSRFTKMLGKLLGR